MADILVKFDEPIVAPRGDKYFAQAVGSEVDGRLWEGWLEFLPVNESRGALESGRETTQPNRAGVEYWSQGLTRVYLQGALARALSLAESPRVPSVTDSMPVRFNTFGHRVAGATSARSPTSPRPVLNPLQVYAQGETILRGELNALSRDHIESIAIAYDLVPYDSSTGLSALSTKDLIARIVDGARARQRPFASDAGPPRSQL